MMKILTTILWLKSHWKTAVKAICAASVAFLLLWGVNTYRQNIKLSQELEMAQNNIEAYLGLLNDSLLANNVLLLDFQKLLSENDEILHKLDSVSKKLKIKPKTIKVGATLSQVVNVNASKGVGGDIITILKDSVYTDSILYNDQTTVFYSIGKDSVDIGIKLENDLYIYLYSTREYKNKKNFFKRLFTWDWKKITKTEYEIYNTNDLIETKNVRVVVSNKK